MRSVSNRHLNSKLCSRTAVTAILFWFRPDFQRKHLLPIKMLASQVSPHMKSNFQIIARTASALSLTGCLFIILTFCLFSSFRKPVTRLIFYASFGNIMTNVMMCMARTYVTRPWNVGCQVQGLIQQWFIPADVLWGFAMALNVYLTFFRKFDTRQLQRMEIGYVFACYGLPFVPAMIFFCMKSSRGKVYGDALLWCWISEEWAMLRMATFYAPIWVFIVCIFSIYISTGRTIYANYREIKAVQTRNQQREVRHHARTVAPKIYVETQHTVCHPDATRPAKGAQWDAGARAASTPYSVTTHITSNHGGMPHAHHLGNGRSACEDAASDTVELTQSTPSNSAWLSSPSRSVQSGITSRGGRRVSVRETPHAIWAYTKCAMLFFGVLIITYVPSTTSRIYQLAFPGYMDLGLTYATVFVLPLQGFWNCLIYVHTNRRACRLLAGQFLSKPTRGSVDKRLSTPSRAHSDRADIELGHAEENRIMRDRTVRDMAFNLRIPEAESKL